MKNTMCFDVFRTAWLVFLTEFDLFSIIMSKRSLSREDHNGLFSSLNLGIRCGYTGALRGPELIAA